MELKHLKAIGMITISLIIFGQKSPAQDLIARQAPIDNKTKIIDSCSLDSLEKLATAEQNETYSSGSDLYPNWDNTHVNGADTKVNIPDNYTIDMTGFCMPANHTRITSSFGVRKRRMHYGIDLKVHIGDTIVAAFDGKVRIVNTERRGYGKYIVIRHNNGLETIYAHLSKQLVEINQTVKAGEVIGLGGNTGRSTGSHLHFETRFLGIAINPTHLFNFQELDIVADTYVFTKTTENNAHLANSIKENSNNSESISYHKVKEGDTLLQIATTKGISLAKLCKLNKITKKTVIRPGQVLRCS
ncbi:Murein DD-endopeptidase MepM [termite gut metagenome]|uniref:Murein DD-endopeptidase MepM n=1 Tax=termite gut metagenome TaxID=433724 RepID=A0A5J4RLH3_9ZZZZ